MTQKEIRTKFIHHCYRAGLFLKRFDETQSSTVLSLYNDEKIRICILAEVLGYEINDIEACAREAYTKLNI